MLKNLSGAFLPVIFSVFVFSTKAGELSLSAQMDRNDIPFEGKVGLAIEIKWQGGLDRYAFGLLPLPSAQGLQVMGTTSAISSDMESGKEVTTRKFHYDFKPTRAGIGTIEPIVLKYVSMPDSVPGELTTQQFQVSIAQPLPKPEKSNIGRNAAIAGAVVILLAALTFWWKERKKKSLPEEPALTPEAKFAEQLIILKKEAASDRKVFFTRLYKILVEYIENKYSVSQAGKSAPAVVEQLNGMEIETGKKEKLIEWITVAEREKYAPISGVPGDTIRMISELEDFFGK
ncbi:hypothetical protein TRIP_C60260 [Candidatus Zixiibacteriota bacterium]|nr:hypothetical protein TRIP_C60260 [candidate division Zixibacteria bacterium]